VYKAVYVCNFDFEINLSSILEDAARLKIQMVKAQTSQLKNQKEAKSTFSQNTCLMKMTKAVSYTDSKF